MSFENNFFLSSGQNEQENTEEHPNTIEYRKILKERDEVKASILQNLQKMNFSQSEIQEVFTIIEEKYKLVENAKQPLINITPDDILNKVEDETKNNIKNISQDMLNELRAKIVEIQARK